MLFFSHPFRGGPLRGSISLPLLVLGALAPLTASSQTVAQVKAGHEVTATRLSDGLYATLDSSGTAWEFDRSGGPVARYDGVVITGLGPASNAAELLRDPNSWTSAYQSLDGLVPVVDTHGNPSYESRFAGNGASATVIMRNPDLSFSGIDSVGATYSLGAPDVDTINWLPLDGGKVLAGTSDGGLRLFDGAKWVPRSSPGAGATFVSGSMDAGWALFRFGGGFSLGHLVGGDYDYSPLGPLFNSDYSPSSVIRDDGSFMMGRLDRLAEFGPGGTLASMSFLDAGTAFTGGSDFYDAGDGGWLFALNDGSGRSTYRYSPQAVPEPAPLAALGLGALALVRRRSPKRNP